MAPSAVRLSAPPRNSIDPRETVPELVTGPSLVKLTKGLRCASNLSGPTGFITRGLLGDFRIPRGAMLLESKVTLTSGAGGVGGAVAKAFARGDASVFLANCALSRPEPITTETKAKDGKAEMAKVGDAFLYRYDDAHSCKMKLVELLPTRKLSGWSQRVTSTSQRTRTSGGGAKLIFELSERDGRSAVRFTHQGPVPAYERYEFGSRVWGDYIRDRLRE